MNVLDQHVGGDFALYNGDSCEVIRGIPDDSLHLTVSSPPFASMWVYSNSPRDVGNSRGIDGLLSHFRFLVGELLRVTMPGRSCCIHVTNINIFKHADGYRGRLDFRGDMIRFFQEHGWIYASEVMIDKCPQIRAQRTKDQGLLFKSLATDASVMTPAMADYMLVFRKPGDSPVPIAAGQSDKYGNPGGWITEAEWIEWAAPVWYRRVKSAKGGLDPCAPCEEHYLPSHPSHALSTTGIYETDCLNVSAARSEEDERHLCPLQLGVIERCMKLWSCPGETVFDPFAGVGSTPYKAILLARKGVGIELKPEYYHQAVRNCCKAEESLKESQLDLLSNLADR